MKNSLLLQTATVLALSVPMVSMAESQLVVGNTATATARLGVSVVIPRVLFLGVGTGSTGLTNDTTVDSVTFNYTNNPQAVGQGTAANQITGNVVPVRVVGNNGNITLSASTTGPLANGAGDTIPWTQITATSSQATLPAPVIPDTGAGATVNVTPSTGKVTDRSANWTFSYANTVTPPAGTYGGTASSRVIYTAAMP
ncbi:hypothetical protein [Hydrogenophaga sp. R2]|uniref:hypothetical protein n=1 Tax=Hydrogenophaga sp. R2 TaxID=3132827 RepID=UPI003CF247AA